MVLDRFGNDCGEVVIFGDLFDTVLDTKPTSVVIFGFEIVEIPDANARLAARQVYEVPDVVVGQTTYLRAPDEFDRETKSLKLIFGDIDSQLFFGLAYGRKNAQ